MKSIQAKIPNGWTQEKFSNRITFQYGNSLPESKRLDGSYPVYGSNGVVGKHSEYLVNGPGIIVGRKGTIGAINWSDENFWPIDTTYFIEQDGSLHLRWLYYKLQSLGLTKMNSASGTPGLNREEVYKLSIEIPTLNEQKKIAEILSVVDEEIFKTDKIISEIKKLKVGLTKTLLEKGIGDQKLKKTVLGQIPSGWEVVTLGEITKQRSVKNASGNIKNVVSVTKYSGIVNSLEYFNKQVFSKDISTYKVIRPGDFAYATIHLDEGSIGFLDSEGDSVLSPMYTVFSVDYRRVDRDFLFSLLKSHRLMNLYRTLGLGSVDRRKSISYENFSKITIALPPLEHQKEIMNILTSCEAKISVNKRIREKLTALKKGLMQDLLSGKKLTV